MELNTRTLKVDRANFFALTFGMEKDDEIIKTAIYVTTSKGHARHNDFRTVPKLITLSKKRSYKCSNIGEKLLEKYKNVEITTFKHVAVLTTIFHIENKIEIWKELCTNGIFDVWEPEGGPFMRLRTGDDPMILLLRLYEIANVYSVEDINISRVDNIAATNRKVLLNKPLIQDAEFDEICKKIKETLDRYNAIKEIKYLT